MSNQYLLKESRTLIEIAKTPFAGGGEGDLYKIKSPAAYRNYVAKIYHPHKISKEREEKTEYLINNPPVGLSENGSIVWIKDALYTPEYQFAGFIMPFARGKKLEMLCLGKLPKKIGADWQRFDLKNPAALQYRMRICFNLAAAIYQMHATEHYVLVDMKPENILLQPNGLLAIVDTDSVEVIENDVAIFPAPVATPEYTPPEFYTNEHRKNTTVGESWDRFGLAVIFYKLLCGIHPFAGSAHVPYDNLVSLHEKIEHGLFVHRTENQDIFSVIPPPHRQFEKLETNLQALFIQCFEEGHTNPEARPTANDWCSALLVAIGDAELEARFAHIMGMWGNYSRIKIEMPSSLFRKNITTIHPKRWLESKIEASFETLPPLPITLHQAIESGKQQIKLALGARDYQISWLLFLGALLPILFSTTLGEWFIGDFWLSEAWFINVIALLLMILPLIVLPRLISWIRHIASPQTKIRKLWNKFRLTYPALKRDVVEIKRVLSNELLKHNKEEMDIFEAQRTKYEVPLKKYLSEQDQKVKTLMDTRKDQLDGINQKYLKQAEKNRLLLDMKGRSVFTLNKRLKDYYQKKLKSIGQDAIQALKEDFEAAKLLLEKLIELEKGDVEQIEIIYENQYQVVYKESEAEVLKIRATIENLNEEYKIEVNRLLATHNVEKIQLSMKEKIEQAKKDIITLERLKF